MITGVIEVFLVKTPEIAILLSFLYVTEYRKQAVSEKCIN